MCERIQFRKLSQSTMLFDYRTDIVSYLIWTKKIAMIRNSNFIITYLSVKIAEKCEYLIILKN